MGRPQLPTLTKDAEGGGAAALRQQQEQQRQRQQLLKQQQAERQQEQARLRQIRRQQELLDRQLLGDGVADAIAASPTSSPVLVGPRRSLIMKREREEHDDAAGAAEAASSGAPEKSLEAQAASASDTSLERSEARSSDNTREPAKAGRPGDGGGGRVLQRPPRGEGVELVMPKLWARGAHITTPVCELHRQGLQSKFNAADGVAGEVAGRCRQ